MLHKPQCATPNCENVIFNGFWDFICIAGDLAKYTWTKRALPGMALSFGNQIASLEL